MNCAWCGKNDDGSGSHGICTDCMLKYFGVDALILPDERANETLECVLGANTTKDMNTEQKDTSYVSCR